jgi:serine phosphatase RsbU (regulator of sigma subunit)
MTSPNGADLDLAGQVQRLLFPKSSPVCDWNCVGVKNRMAQGLGGDYFDFLNMPENCLTVFIGDVTGHGLHASVVMSLLYGFIYRSSMHISSALDIVRQANSFLNAFATRSADFDYLFSSTLFIGVIAPDTLKMHYVNAGHPAPLVRRGDRCLTLGPTAPPVGFFTDPEITMNSFQLARGDRILLYTDGITELFGPTGEPFGDERLTAFLMNEGGDHEEFLDRLFARLRAFGNNDDPEDDFTAIIIDMHGNWHAT